EQRAERFLEVVVDRAERLGEPLPRRFVNAGDRLARLRDGVYEILALAGEKHVARLELVELLDGHHVDRTQAIDLRAQGDDRFFGAESALLRRGNGISRT